MHIGHVILVSSAGCALWSWRRTQFVESPIQTRVDMDPAAIADELSQLEAAPIAVLVDMTDEEHLRDTVARLGRRDQQALLERKLARAFPRTRLRTTQLQGHSARSPDEDQVLMSALSRPEPVRILLQRLAEARLPVAGVFSPALLTDRLLDAQARAAGAVMLVLRRSNGRLQHSFFRHGKLAGSRRLRATGAAGIEDASFLIRQIEESLRYFEPTFAASAEQPLQVLLTAADLELLAAEDECPEAWQLRLLDAAEFRKRLHILAPLRAEESEQVFVELLRHTGATANFAPPAERRYFQHFRARSYGKVACLVLAGAALAGALRNGLEIIDAEQQLAGSTSTAQQLEALLPAPPAAGAAAVDPLEMQQVVAAYEALESRQADPQEVLAAIGAAVTARPRIQVDAIQWRVGPAVDDIVPAESGGEMAAAEPMDASDEGAADEPATATDGVLVTLRGHIKPFNGDYPLAFDELAAFIAALQADPAVETVSTRVQPLDVSPASTLSGELARGRVDVEAPFTLVITLRLGHEPV